MMFTGIATGRPAQTTATPEPVEEVERGGEVNLKQGERQKKKRRKEVKEEVVAPTANRRSCSGMMVSFLKYEKSN